MTNGAATSAAPETGPRLRNRGLGEDDGQDGGVPVKGNGPGIEVAVISVLGALLVAVGFGVDFVTARVFAEPPNPAFRIRASMWKLCLNRLPGAFGMTTDTERQSFNVPATAFTEGCRNFEDSVCAGDVKGSSGALYIARTFFFLTIGCYLLLALFSVLHRCRAVEKCFASVASAPRGRQKLYKYPMQVLNGLALLFSIGAVALTVRLYFLNCLSGDRAVSPGLIVLGVSVICPVAIAVIVQCHRPPLDYQRINRVIEERNQEVQKKALQYQERKKMLAAAAPPERVVQERADIYSEDDESKSQS